MTQEKPLKAMIVGCGSIGALKPDKFDRPYGQNILTHAHAYRVSPDVRLCGVVDTNEDKAIQAAKKWGVLRNTNMIEALNDWKPDIVSVCVPTEHHCNVLFNLTTQPHIPRLVIIEKPFCMNLKEAKKIKRLYERMNIPLLVNYNRRFSLGYREVRERILKRELGEIRHARLLYGRGLLRDGCHGLDVFNWFLGSIHGIIVRETLVDNLPEDPTVSMFLSYERCPDVQLVGIDSRKYGIFEMELVGDKEIVKFTENGLWVHYYRPVEESLYGAYKAMPSIPYEGRRVDLTNTLSRMVSNAADFLLRRDGYLVSTEENAIVVHEIIDAVSKVNELTEKEKKKRCLN